MVGQSKEDDGHVTSGSLLHSDQSNRFKSASHVIFDMDGLLLDTETHYTTAIQSVLDQFGQGQKFTWEMKQRTMGRKWRDSVQMFIDQYQLKMTVDQFISETDKILRQLFPTAQLMSGAEKLIRHLHNNRIPICICTGSSKSVMAVKIERHRQLFSLFDHVICSPDEPEVVRGKPEPDVFLVGMNRFPEKPVSNEHVLVFEDAFNGVQAALKANMQVVLVPDPRMSHEDRSHATLCLNSLEEFRPELFGLPTFD